MHACKIISNITIIIKTTYIIKREIEIGISELGKNYNNNSNVNKLKYKCHKLYLKEKVRN